MCSLFDDHILTKTKKADFQQTAVNPVQSVWKYDALHTNPSQYKPCFGSVWA